MVRHSIWCPANLGFRKKIFFVFVLLTGFNLPFHVSANDRRFIMKGSAAEESLKNAGILIERLLTRAWLGHAAYAAGGVVCNDTIMASIRTTESFEQFFYIPPVSRKREVHRTGILPFQPENEVREIPCVPIYAKFISGHKEREYIYPAIGNCNDLGDMISSRIYLRDFYSLTITKATIEKYNLRASGSVKLWQFEKLSNISDESMRPSSDEIDRIFKSLASISVDEVVQSGSTCRIKIRTK
ncbi:hypothetical protein ACQKLX_05095 [Bosea sp. NPDC003192]|uniref:hypothetical protein n=1 Tax=Bosea sp. NPDC003192 TaxID=3390551 RepID=UPI003D052537